MRLSIFAAIALLASVSSVHAENWKFTGRDTQDAIAVEFDSIRKTATGARVWIASISADKSAPAAGLFGNDIQVTRSLFEADCVGERIRIIQTSYLSRELAHRGSIDPPEPKWSYPAPGTVGENVAKIACGRKDSVPVVGSYESLPATVEQYFLWRRFGTAAN